MTKPARIGTERKFIGQWRVYVNGNCMASGPVYADEHPEETARELTAMADCYRNMRDGVRRTVTSTVVPLGCEHWNIGGDE